MSTNEQPVCLWRAMTGEKLSETVVGLFGAITALMIVYENWPVENKAK